MSLYGKLPFTLCAMLLLAACSDKDADTPEEHGTYAIEFVEPVLNNMSRNSEAKFPYNKFNVFAFTDNPRHYLYNGADVSRRADGDWVCDQQEYWYPGHTYWFTAIAPMDSAGVTFEPVTDGTPPFHGGGTLRFRPAETGAHTDLLYAFRKEVTPSAMRINAPVDLEFNHLLAQVTFTFYNELGNPHYFINVPSIVLGNLCSEGVIDLNTPSPEWERSGYETFWTGAGSVYTVKVNAPKTSQPVYMLPIRFSGGIIQLQTHLFYIYNPDDTEGLEFSGVKTFTVDFPAIDFKPGHSYNLVTHLNHSNVDGPDDELTPISFEIEDRSWRYDYMIDVNVR